MIKNHFEFVTNEYIQVGSTNKNCLRLIPNSTKKSHSFIIGDESGTVNSFEYSKGELNLEWKTSPIGKEISRIELSGPFNARDRIFYSGGTMLRGVSKKGKEFWKLDTNLTETIKAFGIEDTSSIWTAGDYLLNEFEVGKDRVADKAYYLSPDKVNDVFIHSILPGNYNPILACQDKAVRVINGEEVLYSYAANSAVNCIHPYSAEVKNPTSKKDLDRTLVYGLSNGSFINVSMEPDKPVYLWSVGVENNSKKAGISLIKVFDFQARGINDVIVVRDDSTIELYSMNSDQEFELFNQSTVSEGITGLDAGSVFYPGLNEFVISTYSGKVIGYVDNEELNKTDLKKNKEAPKDTDKKIKALRAEIDKLKQDLDKLKAENASEGGSVSTNVNTFKISYKMVRNTDDASYSIHIDSQYPIEIVGIQSLVKVELLEIDSNVGILSICPEDSDNKYALSATYRFVDANLSKFEIKLRTIEGQYGDINCFVIPNANPKTCQAFNISLKPLSLHERHSEQIDIKSMSMNYLKITGSFSKNDIHTWISACLPDMPQNVTDDETNLVYRSSYVGSFLHFSYQAGLGEFYSESITTITILKDVISLQASNRSVQISISWDINNQSVVKMIDLLAPKFAYNQNITQKYQLLIALKELSNQEGNSNFLSKDSKKILEEANEIEKTYKAQPKRVEYLRSIIFDLYKYTDKAKANGNSNISQKLNQLSSILNNFDQKNLLDFFKN